MKQMRNMEKKRRTALEPPTQKRATTMATDTMATVALAIDEVLAVSE